MKQKLLYTLGLIVLGWAVIAAVPAEAAKNTTGPRYEPPSWDQTLPANQRFIVLTNMNSEAVLDKETGLVWEQSPSTTEMHWEDAQTYCNELTTGGRQGWGLPTIQELSSLVDPTQENPSLPSGHPFSNVQSSFYWSATTFASDTSSAWGVVFDYGYMAVGDKGYDGYVWCVRGGHGVDPQ